MDECKINNMEEHLKQYSYEEMEVFFDMLLDRVEM